MPRKAVRYPKELAKPMPPRGMAMGGILSGQTQEEVEAEKARIEGERAREVVARMETLREFYGVNNYFMLAYMLAEQMVPGLREAKGPAGRPRTENPWDMAQVRCAADAIIEGNATLSVTSALAILSKRPGKPWHGKSVPNLRRIYYATTPELVKIMRMVAAWDTNNCLPVGERELAPIPAAGELGGKGAAVGKPVRKPSRK